MICTKTIVLASFVVGATRLALAAWRGSVAGDPLQPRGHPVGGDAPDPHPLAAGGAAAHDLDVAGRDAEGVGEQAPYRKVGPAALGSLGDLDLERVPVPPGDTRTRRSRLDMERDNDGSVVLHLGQLRASSTPEPQHGGRPTVHREAGLLSERRDGTRRLYALRPEAIEPVRSFLDDLWPSSLARLKAAVEADRPQSTRR